MDRMSERQWKRWDAITFATSLRGARGSRYRFPRCDDCGVLLG
jgi:hypothetical protein